MNVILVLLLLALAIMRLLTKYLKGKTAIIQKETDEINRSIAEMEGKKTS